MYDMAAKMKTARPAPKRVAKPEPAPTFRSTDVLASALQRAFEMAPEDALATASTVADCFGEQHEVNDETIPSEVRSLFYTLESKRLLSFRRIEYDTPEGQKRRAFFWRLRPETVAELTAAPESPLDEDVYAALPSECWARAKAEA